MTAPLSQPVETKVRPPSKRMSAVPLIVPMPVARSQAADRLRSPQETIFAFPDTLPMSRTSFPSPRAVRLTFPIWMTASPREEPTQTTLIPFEDISKVPLTKRMPSPPLRPPPMQTTRSPAEEKVIFPVMSRMIVPYGSLYRAPMPAE